MKISLVAIAILALLAAHFFVLQSVPSLSANPERFFPLLSMPVEFINYTITSINGELWAKIDGKYPIYILNPSGCESFDELPMFYPMPPGSTNIEVNLDGRELKWVNYTAVYPLEVHKTAIGDWWMIQSTLTNLSDYFTLEIHYEHPLQNVNESYLFLYDLNISPYLSPQSTESSAYFTVKMETDFKNLKVYAAPPESSSINWKPLDYTIIKENSLTIVNITMNSKFGKPLVGDLAVEFSEANKKTDSPLWLPIMVLIILFIAILFLLKKKGSILSKNASKTTKSNYTRYARP